MLMQIIILIKKTKFDNIINTNYLFFDQSITIVLYSDIMILI